MGLKRRSFKHAATDPERVKGRSLAWKAFVAFSLKLRSVRIQLIILLSFAQVISSMEIHFDIPFTELQKVFFDWVRCINLQLSDFFDVRCSIKINYYTQLLFQTIMPLCGSAACVVAFFLSRERIYISASLFILFICYPIASNKIFRVFACTTFDDGSKFLRVDHSLRCEGSTYSFYRFYGTIMVAVWPIGVPLLFFLVLFPKRSRFRAAQQAIDAKKARDAIEIDGILGKHNARVLKKTSKRRARIAALEVVEAEDTLLERSMPDEKIELPKLTSFLFEQYQPKYYWFESVELIYKLSVTGVVVFFEACGMSTASQMIYCLVCTFLSLTLLMLLQPYAATSSNRVQIFARSVILLGYIYGLSTFVAEPVQPDKCADNGIVTFADFTSVMFFFRSHHYDVAALSRVFRCTNECPESRASRCEHAELEILVAAAA